MKIRNPKSEIRKKSEVVPGGLRPGMVRNSVIRLGSDWLVGRVTSCAPFEDRSCPGAHRVACSSGVRETAFTLIELLVVIGIMGILAAITVPAFNTIKKADAGLAATRQLLDDVGHARQRAISSRTTVYMVFCPANFWSDPAFPPSSSPEYAKRTNLFDKQLTGYALVTTRSVGEQPGRRTPRYLTAWRTLPEGAIIAPSKFGPRANYVVINDPTKGSYVVRGFNWTNNIPFPSENAPLVGGRFVALPYIAFNFLGQLTQDGVNPSGQDEFIPLARGAVDYARDAAKVLLPAPPDVSERPPGNSTNAFNLIHIDWLTGRARVERPEIGGS